MNLIINTTRRVSSADMRMTCEPALYFQVRAYFGIDTSRQMVSWQQSGGNDAKEAANILSQVFMSVCQNGESYKLNTPADVMALRDAVEASNPGDGDGFICVLLHSFVSNHYNFFQKAETGSANLSPESDIGSEAEPIS